MSVSPGIGSAMGPHAGPGGRRPAGWRPDPTERFDERFFDGRSWTKRVRVDGAVAIDTDRNVNQAGDGWLPDPMQRFERRRFNGARWTKQICVGDAIAVDIRGVPADIRRPKQATSPSPTGTATRPPGWYPEPEGEESWQFWDGHSWGGRRERYWDGFQWTAKARPRQARRSVSPYRRIKVAAIAAAVVTVIVVLLLVLFVF